MRSVRVSGSVASGPDVQPYVRGHNAGLRLVRALVAQHSCSHRRCWQERIVQSRCRSASIRFVANMHAKYTISAAAGH